MKDPIDFHCGLGSVLEEGGEANVIVGCCRGSGGGGLHCFVNVCAVVESEEIGWFGRWGGAVGWGEGDMFDGC